MNTKRKVTIILIIALAIITGCKEENTTSPIKFFGSRNGGDNGYEILSHLDNPNVIGIVQFDLHSQDRYVFDYDGSGNYQLNSGQRYYLQVKIANPSKTQYVSLSPAPLMVNAFKLIEFGTGLYYVPDELGIEHYYGNGYNKIVIDSNQYFDVLVDSVTFSSGVLITNILPGDII